LWQPVYIHWLSYTTAEACNCVGGKDASEDGVNLCLQETKGMGQPGLNIFFVREQI